jgi:hypothetical protein
LNHRRNEAVFEEYSGFHQWNFDTEDGNFIIWNKKESFNVTKILSDLATVKVTLVGDQISVNITKNAELPMPALEYERRIRAGLLEAFLELA